MCRGRGRGSERKKRGRKRRGRKKERRDYHPHWRYDNMAVL